MEEVNRLTRQSMCNDVGQIFADRGLTSSCLSQAYLLSSLINYDLIIHDVKDEERAKIVFGYVEDHEYKKAWGHFWVEYKDEKLDSSSITYWILYHKYHPGKDCIVKQPSDRSIVTVLTKGYEYIDSEETINQQRLFLSHIQLETHLFEAIQSDCSLGIYALHKEIWYELCKKYNL